MLRLLEAAGSITGGQVVFQSEELGQVDLLQLPEKQLLQLRGNEISMVFQEPMSSLNPVYTCGQQVTEVLLLHTSLSKKQAKEHTIALFEQAKLPRPDKIYEAYPHEISGGQVQRVMIAMAMACEPSLLIADEPTTALDVTVQARMLQLIDELRVKDNTAVLFITHDLGVVAEIADRILVMYKGKIVEQGSVLEVFSQPQHPYTKGLLACRPTLSATPQSVLPTVSDFMEEDAQGCVLEKPLTMPKDSLPGTVTGNSATVAGKSPNKADRPLLQVEDLKVYFPVKKSFFGRSTAYVKAVDGVSFSVWPGETIGLVGESGCGKTTLGRSLLHLIKPSAGKVIFGGNDVALLSPAELRQSRRNLQMIFQDPQASLNPMHTVGEAVMEPMRVHKRYASDKERRVKATELLEKVGITPGQFHCYPHVLSGGQQQRVCIARALALQPK